MTAVLVIEDDGVIARAMGAHLRTSGFDFEWADDGTKGLRKLRFERPDVCVVDLMLPGLDGWGLIERARDEGLMTPILAVSARGNEHDKVATLSLGADDYLAKPFGMAEFMARVQALARRARSRRRRSASWRSSSPVCASIPPSTAPSCSAPRARRSTPGSRARSSGCCTSWRATPAACSAATSCTSASGTCPTGTATARSTCSCASCARSSTGARLRLRAHPLRRRLPLRRRAARQRRRLTYDRPVTAAAEPGRPIPPRDRISPPPGLGRAALRERRDAACAAAAHRRVPFENLDIQLGIPIELDARAFAERIALSGRGGFCYQLNGAFAYLLAGLGFAVELLEARVHGPGRLGGRFGHLCLRVRIDGSERLADVGFGRGGFDEPIAIAPGIAQPDTAGVFRLVPLENGTLDMLCDEVPEYRVSLDGAAARRLRARLPLPPDLPGFSLHPRERLHDPHARGPGDARRNAPDRTGSGEGGSLL